jgi:hypothetical protein
MGGLGGCCEWVVWVGGWVVDGWWVVWVGAVGGCCGCDGRDHECPGRGVIHESVRLLATPDVVSSHLLPSTDHVLVVLCD